MHTILNGDAGSGAALFCCFDSAHAAARQLTPGLVTSSWRIAGERKAQRAARKAASRTWSSSPTWGSYTDLVLRGMGGTPMVNRKAGVPRVRGTRTPTIAAALLVCSMTAPRKGRGVLLSGFAGEVLASSTLPSRLEKRLFLGVNALFFIARNEGSSMTSDNYTCIHRIKYTLPRGKHKNDPQTRAMLSSRFRAMYRNLGLSRLDIAQLLHVTERTLHNWDTGHHEIPYSAYRLLRLLTRQELPGKAWAGWHLTAGVLWSPEGHGFKPEDSTWWSMLCRRSAQFHSLYEENNRLRCWAAVAARVPEPIVQANQGVEIGSQKGRSLVTPSFFPRTGNFSGNCYNLGGAFRSYSVTLNASESCPADQRLARAKLVKTQSEGGAK